MPTNRILSDLGNAMQKDTTFKWLVVLMLICTTLWVLAGDIVQRLADYPRKAGIYDQDDIDRYGGDVGNCRGRVCSDVYKSL